MNVGKHGLPSNQIIYLYSRIQKLLTSSIFSEGLIDDAKNKKNDKLCKKAENVLHNQFNPIKNQTKNLG
jgi:hypothetical protein